MLSVEPIVYSRTYSIDYRFWAIPESLRNLPEFEVVKSHLRHVLSDEDPIHPMRCRRWHVMTVCEKILVGMAAYETDRLDLGGRPIRGYYGVLMNRENVFKPSVSLLHRLDDMYVKPNFEMKLTNGLLYCSEVQGLNMEEQLPISAGRKYGFNTQDSVLRFFDEHLAEDEILSAAISKAKESEKFEFVYGLSSKEHASKMPTMNVLCFGEKPGDIRIHDTLMTPSIQRKPMIFQSKSSGRYNGDGVMPSDTRVASLDVSTNNHRSGRVSRMSPAKGVAESKITRERIEISVECDVGIRYRISEMLDRIVQVLKLIPGVSCFVNRSSVNEVEAKSPNGMDKTRRQKKALEDSPIDFSYGLKVSSHDTVGNVRDW